jgi:transcriptional regulator of arginine metabolism
MKAARHAMILNIIDSMVIETQDELARELKKKNHNVTQATISRDIKELRLVKVLDKDGTYRYASVDRAETSMFNRFIRIFTESVVSIQASGNLVVIKTINASANAAAEAVDSLNWPQVLGTVAGDNTILVVVKSEDMADEVVKKFKAMVYDGE